MGLYAEPAGDKAAWIAQHGTPVYDLRLVEALGCYKPGSTQLPVILLQPFSALGVATDYKELARFLHGRPDGQWYMVDKAELRQVVPGGEKMKELK